MLSIVKFSDVKGEPMAKLDLPGILKVGDPLGLRLRIERKNGGRTEEVLIDGQFRVTAIGVDTVGSHRQLLSVEAAYGKLPVWRSVKTQPEQPRKLSPARSSRTVI